MGFHSSILYYFNNNCIVPICKVSCSYVCVAQLKTRSGQSITASLLSPEILAKSEVKFTLSLLFLSLLSDDERAVGFGNVT
jgi:hypothetical protein